MSASLGLSPLPLRLLSTTHNCFYHTVCRSCSTIYTPNENLQKSGRPEIELFSPEVDGITMTPQETVLLKYDFINALGNMEMYRYVCRIDSKFRQHAEEMQQ